MPINEDDKAEIESEMAKMVNAELDRLREEITAAGLQIRRVGTPIGGARRLGLRAEAADQCCNGCD